MAGFGDFRRYHNGKMSTNEQHLFEKQMLEDPMLAEAYDGFLAMHRNKANVADIKQALNQNLRNRVTGNRKRTIPLWTYGAAASLIITLGTFWVIFISDPQKGDMKETGQNPVEKPLAEAEPAPRSAPETKPEIALPTEKPAPRRHSASKRARERELAIEIPEQRTETDLAAVDNEEQVRVPAAAPVEKQAFGNTARTPMPAATAGRRGQEPKYKKSQTVVAEAASARTLAALPDLTDSVTKLSASPLMGWDAYNAYLEKQASAARRKGEVTVIFYVNADGTLADFTAQGKKQLHSEAIRIVQEGPLWLPARQNGFAVRTPVTVKLLFKK